MRKIKIFISQPMSGLTQENIEYLRLGIKNYLAEEIAMIKGYPCEPEFINNLCEDADTYKPLELLSRSIADLAKADVAYFASGWEKARGCKIEHECAVAYGIDTIYE